MVTQTTGNVAYSNAATSGQWVPVTQNQTLSPGDTLFTQPGAQATLTLCGATLTLAPSTELELNAQDASTCTLTQPQGELYLDLPNPPQNQILTLKTPRGAITLDQSAELDVTAADTTAVAVLSGAATIGQHEIPANEEAYISASGEITSNIQQDDFMQSLLSPPPPPPPPAPEAPEAPAPPTVIYVQPQILLPYGGYPGPVYHPLPPPPPPSIIPGGVQPVPGLPPPP